MLTEIKLLTTGSELLRDRPIPPRTGTATATFPLYCSYIPTTSGRPHLFRLLPIPSTPRAPPPPPCDRPSSKGGLFSV